MYTFRTPPHFAPGLLNAGIDLVSLGNNHAMDFGDEGLYDTMAALDAAGVPYTGAGVNEAHARTPVLSSRSTACASPCCRTARSPRRSSPDRRTPASRTQPSPPCAGHPGGTGNADVVIVALHAGTQYVDVPNFQQVQLSRAAVDAGATLVLGHHAHTLQGWTQYNGGTIVYGLGNFVFDLDDEDLYYLGPRAYETAVLHMTLTKDGVSEHRSLAGRARLRRIPPLARETRRRRSASSTAWRGLTRPCHREVTSYRLPASGLTLLQPLVVLLALVLMLAVACGGSSARVLRTDARRHRRRRSRGRPK